jgi:hypothetical protein
MIEFLLPLIAGFVNHMKKSGRLVSIISDQYLLVLITVKSNHGNMSK